MREVFSRRLYRLADTIEQKEVQKFQRTFHRIRHDWYSTIENGDQRIIIPGTTSSDQSLHQTKTASGRHTTQIILIPSGHMFYFGESHDVRCANFTALMMTLTAPDIPNYDVCAALSCLQTSIVDEQWKLPRKKKELIVMKQRWYTHFPHLRELSAKQRKTLFSCFG
jgi:hypothetical protein